MGAARPGSGGNSLLRSIAVIVWAISFANPSLSTKQAEIYAKVLQKEAVARKFDPFTGVAIIQHESRWRPGVISPDGEDYGLGQVRARYARGCRNDADPVNNPSATCKAAKRRLLNGSFNIRRMSSGITSWRKLCRKTTGRPALFHRWLHGYGGMAKRQGRRWKHICGQRRTKRGWRDLPKRKSLLEIINYRKKLIRLLSQKRRRERRRAGRSATIARSRRRK
jgi:hypothetical protein